VIVGLVCNRCYQRSTVTSGGCRHQVCKLWELMKLQWWIVWFAWHQWTWLNRPLSAWYRVQTTFWFFVIVSHLLCLFVEVHFTSDEVCGEKILLLTLSCGSLILKRVEWQSDAGNSMWPFLPCGVSTAMDGHKNGMSNMPSPTPSYVGHADNL
jgi:hypothetical protein